MWYWNGLVLALLVLLRYCYYWFLGILLEGVLDSYLDEIRVKITVILHIKVFYVKINTFSQIIKQVIRNMSIMLLNDTIKSCNNSIIVNDSILSSNNHDY